MYFNQENRIRIEPALVSYHATQAVSDTITRII